MNSTTIALNNGPLYRYIDDASHILAAIKGHSESNPMALDLETTGLDPFKDRISDVVISDPDNAEGALAFSPEHIPLLNHARAPLILHNFKFDFRMLSNYGVDLRHLPITDTMLLHHLHDENKQHNLDFIIQELFRDNYKEVFWSKFKTYEEADDANKLLYACKDVIYTKKIYFKLIKDLETQGIPQSLITHIHNLALALYNTELYGVCVDMERLLDLGSELKKCEESLLREARECSDHECNMIELDMWAKELAKRKTDKGKAGVKRPEFNFSSTQQIQELLYRKLGLPVIADPKTRKPTASDYALQKLGDSHPVVDKLRGIRKVQKMYGAFIEGVTDKLHSGRVHPSFNVNGTVTGRISCSEPNLQQMPARGDWAKIRSMFIPSPGHSLITCDYSQLEICIAAHYSADPVLLDMVRNGESMHDYTAKATGLTRDQAKKMNFTVLYGGTAYKVAQDLNCTHEQAQKYLDMLLNAYQGLKAIIYDCHKRVETGTPIQSVFGRIRHFSANYETDSDLNRAKRQAFNSLIQGTGADATHMAFWRIGKELSEKGIGRALFPVHDEIVVEAKQGHDTEVIDIVKNNMIQVGKDVGLLVPLSVDCSEPLYRWEK